MKMAEKVYKVILADPPWRYAQSGCRGAAENHYPTMSLAEICALPISGLAADDSVLLMWTTWPQLVEGFEVIKAWGFDYITGFPWIKIVGDPTMNFWGEWDIKPQYGVGFWVRGCTEPLLIARRGHVSPPTDGFIGLLSENLRHSRKPENIYHYAEKLEGPYLELFARRPRAGWDSWGNQVETAVQIEETIPCNQTIQTKKTTLASVTTAKTSAAPQDNDTVNNSAPAI